MNPKIALQLWSVKEACEADLKTTLSQIKAFGYDGVEFAGYFGHSAHELKQELKELQLEVVASHIPFEQLRDHLQETLDYESALGNFRIVIPYASFESMHEWEQFSQRIKEVEQETSKRGMTLLYHNHAHEFQQIPDVDIVDWLTQQLPTLKLEVDTYWVATAEKEVITWLETHESAVDLLHVKDQKKSPIESTELGKGVLPLKDYVRFAKKKGLEWLVVEQEAFQEKKPLEAASENARTLKELIEEVYG